jgi:hypothetical protein
MSRLRSFASSLVDGTGASGRRRAPLPCAALLALAALTVFAIATSGAGAALQPATPPSFGTPGGEAGQLSGPTAVATNDTSHDVYVADPGNARIDQFGQDGSFIRAFGWGVVASGPDNDPVNEVQEVTVVATEGHFTLALNGEPTAELSFEAEASAVQTALEGVPGIGAANVAVTGAKRGPWQIEFIGALADQNVAELTAEPIALEPGPVTVATTTQGGGAFEICEPAAGDLCQAGQHGSGAGQLNDPVGIAVDNSTGSSTEDVYVADSNRILKFSKAGAFLGVNDGSGRTPSPVPFTGLAALATDGSGDVWSVDSATGKVDEFNPGGAYVEGSEFADGYASTTAIAVDPGATKLYLMHGAHGETSAWDPAHPGVGVTLVDDGGSAFTAQSFFYHGLGLAVDPAGEDLYIQEVGFTASFTFEVTVVRYGPSGGAALEHFNSQGTITANEEGGQGLAYDPGAAHPGSAPGALYLVEAPVADVRVFAPPPLIPPIVGAASAVGVTATGADVQAQVNPNLYDTKVHFEYVTQAHFESAGFTGAATTPEVDIGAAGTAQTAGTHLTGLQPETTYHYRAVASNGNGAPVTGPEATLTTQAAAGEPQSCPNEALRTGFSAALPDCRAYDLVSPADKNGGYIFTIDEFAAGGVVEASPDGSAVTFVSQASFEGTPGEGQPKGNPTGSQYLATAGPAGSWATHNITAPTGAPYPGPHYGVPGKGSPYKIFSTDLGHGLLASGFPPFPLPGAPIGYPNYFLRDTASGALTPLLTQQLTDAAGRPLPRVHAVVELLGATPDLSQAVVSTPAALTPGANYIFERSNLYEFSPGGPRAINVLPGVTDGETAVPSYLGAFGAESHTISADGSRVFFTYRPENATNKLYLRQGLGTSDPTTVELDEPDQGVGGAGGNGEFRDASTDGSRAFFTDGERLTSDSTACGFSFCADLYEYDLAKPQGRRLTDLSVATAPEPCHEGVPACGAQVQGVLGASADGSSVYFVANGVLAPGASPGDCTGDAGEPPTDTCNLYLSHDGTVSFIAALGGAEDRLDWYRGLDQRTTRVSPDGTHLLFLSHRSLTGYDNTIATGAHCQPSGFVGQPMVGSPRCDEVYLYDAGQGQLTCVSCNPTGARPLGPSSIPAATDFELGGHGVYQSRLLSEAGGNLTGAFFDSSDALVPTDTDGAEDIYEYEGGLPRLISGGSSPSGSQFVDASSDGRDVFFITSQGLVSADGDGVPDLYDASVDGGQTPAAATAGLCEGDACHPAPGAPGDPTLSTTVPSGPGNPKPSVKCKKNQVQKHGHCVKKQHPKKSNKRHAKSKQRANTNRRSAK